MIDVIIPAYNSGIYIERCIKSIISQTIFEQLHPIIINDGSTDDTLQIAYKYSKQYSNITVINHNNNSGVSGARNSGLRESYGEYIAFVDSDDYLENCFFEKLLKNIVDTGSDIVCCGFKYKYKDKEVVKKSKIEGVLDAKEGFKEFLKDGNIDPQVTTKLFRRQIIEDVIFDTEMSIGEDKLFVLQSITKVNLISIIKEADYNYIMNPSSAVNSFSIKSINSIRVAQKMIQIAKELYPDLLPLANSASIDTKCRLYSDILRFGKEKEYVDILNKLQKEINEYSLKDKIINSNIKHILAFFAIRLSPKLYIFLKYNMKLQYR